MKWPPSKGYQNQDIQRNSNHQGYISHSTSQIAKMIICFVCTGFFLSGDSDRLKTNCFFGFFPSVSQEKSAKLLLTLASES
ncbi:MAG: hypothetical protein HC930_11880 [Hydrococcus sp. SU_1_0]|nr:hypothetical protein [Hydrococcus sp. SU_1_0]